MKNLDKFLFGILLLGLLPISVAAQHRWQLADDGSIVWPVKRGEVHSDHIEMSGRQVSVVFRYGVDATGAFHMNKGMVWPLLRTVPNNTHASLMRKYGWNPLDAVTINGAPVTGERVERISLKGKLRVESHYDRGYWGKWKLVREYLPSPTAPACVEIYHIINEGKGRLRVELPDTKILTQTDAAGGVTGSYCIEQAMDRHGNTLLRPGDTLTFSCHTSAWRKGEPPVRPNAMQQKLEREKLVDEWMNHLVLQTPDSVINRMFAFAKIRACESIYQTKGGPMHGPGGESFYAAIWANDQAEYVNPFFPYMGYEYGNASAFNSYRHFARFMNDEWKPIPSSIIAEGLDIWNGAGDRGDGAMIAYGAARYVLARGDRAEAEALWPLIKWCLEYCHRKLTPEGVVASDSDELENRFPSGKANLCTSSLYYDALISATYLCHELGVKGAKVYERRAVDLRKAIEKYFGAEVEGYATYRYYKENKVLRSWICIPLTVGIDERAEGTLQALFSDRLWTKNGLLTQAGSHTFWDRSTLYALRGAYAVGAAEKATDYLQHYSATRLLGDHVPYAIEAWPEGNQRHLSAESGLYARILIEGMLGIRPIGFKDFVMTPRLPHDWNEVSLRQIRAFGSAFDISVQRTDKQRLLVTISEQGMQKTYRVREGEPLKVRLR